MSDSTKIIVNGVEQTVPCKKAKLDTELTPEQIKTLIQQKQKELEGK